MKTYVTDVQRSTATKWLSVKGGYKKSVIKEANIRVLKLEITFAGLPQGEMKKCTGFLFEIGSFGSL